MLIIFTIGFIFIFGLIKNIIRNKPGRFYTVNFLIIVIYNLIGWWCIMKFWGVGGESLGAGLLLLFVTGLHLVILLLIFTIREMIRFIKNRRASE